MKKVKIMIGFLIATCLCLVVALAVTIVQIEDKNNKSVKDSVRITKVFVPVKDTTDYSSFTQRLVYAEHKLQLKEDSCKKVIDRCKFVSDSLYEENLIYKMKIEQIKRYVKIVDRNASQIKFLKGWVKRVIYE